MQEGTLDTILREDSKHGRQGYYPASIQVKECDPLRKRAQSSLAQRSQVYRAENQTTALVIWEKGYGVR